MGVFFIISGIAMILIAFIYKEELKEPQGSISNWTILIWGMIFLIMGAVTFNQSDKINAPQEKTNKIHHN